MGMGLNVHQWRRALWLAPVLAVAAMALTAVLIVQAKDDDAAFDAAQPATAPGVASQAALPRLAPGDCGRLCDNDFWASAGPADVWAEVARGADLAAPDGDLGGGALHIAATYSANPEAIAALLDAGANLEAANLLLGATPLHLAAAFNPEPTITALLLDTGANPEARTRHGWSAVHMTMGMNANPDAPEVMDLLLARGADAAALTDDGRTACQVAQVAHPEGETLPMLCQ